MTSTNGGRYRYPDPGERITLTLINQSGVSPGAWGAQEENILNHFESIVRQGETRHLLDYGSGTGRLATRFARLFETVTSFEPDAARAREQRAAVAGTPWGSRIAVIEDVNELGHDYDAVLCSHVIQHVPQAVAARVIKEVTVRVRQAGVVALLTTLSPDSETHFVLNYVDGNGSAIENPVSAEVFEDVLERGEIGVLPIRFFPFVGLVDDLDRSGLDIVAVFGFHGSPGLVGPVKEVSPELLRSRDVALIALRR